jgi:hypothetical protein
MSREYPHGYKLGRGLSPEAHMRTDQGGLMSICKNVRLGGDDGYYPVIIPTPDSITNLPANCTWPYPQIFHAKNTTIVATATAVYELDEARSTIGTALSMYDCTDITTELAIDTGVTQPWHFASVEDYWYMTNGQSQVFKLPGISTAAPGRVYVANTGVLANDTVITTKVESVVAHKNRFVFGGITGVATDVGADWATIFKAWRYNAADSQPTSDEQVFGDDWLLWGEVGGGDVDWPFYLIMQLLAMHAGTAVTRTREFMLSQIEKGHIGMVRVSASSSIRRVETKGPDLLVMSDNMSCIAVGQDNGGYTPGQTSNHGIAGRGAYSAGLMIDQNGELVNTQEGFEVLGYETELDDSGDTPLTYASISMVHNAHEGETYISDGLYGYVYNRYGLARVTTFISCVMDGNVGVTTGVTGANTFDIQTLVENFGFNGVKTVTVMEVLSHGLTVVAAYVSFWEPELAQWVELGPIYGSPDGTFDLMCSGSQFKFRYTGILAAGDKLEKLLVRYQFAEGKSVRGPRGSGLGPTQSGAAQAE